MSDYFITPFVSAQENNPKELQNVGLWHYPCWKLRAARERPHRLNILLIGAPGVGKSTFINTLFNSEIIPSERNRTADDFQTAIFCGALGEGGITLEVEVIELLGYNSAARLSNQKYSQQILQLFQDRFQCCYEAENSFPRDLKTALNQAINAIIYFVPPTFTQFTTDEIALFRELQQAALLIPVIAKADMYTEEELKDRKLLVTLMI
jgi:septin 7